MISVREYLNKKGFEWREERGQAVMNCPFCDDHERKFAIGLENGAFNCFHLNNCGVKGSFAELQKRLGDEPQRLYGSGPFLRSGKKTYKLPKTEIPKISDPCTEYLKRRGFVKETVKHFRLGAKDNKVIMFPYYRGETLVNVKYRDINNKPSMWTEKEAEPILFNRDQIEGDTLIICEGEYDAMALHQYGWEAVSVPMGAKNFEWVDNEWEYMDTFKTIYLCFDMDGVGQEAANELAEKLGKWRCLNVSLPCKDANECLASGVTRERIEECFRQASEYTPALLATPTQFAESVKELFMFPDAANGVPTPWEKLDEILKGWREQELTIWSGRNSSGKSTILNQVVIDLANQGIRSCIASLEMPAKRYLKWAVTQYTGNHHPHPSLIDKALNYFDGRMYIVNTAEETEPHEILDVFAYAARRFDAKHFVIDSLMRVKLPNRDELNEQKEFVSSLVSFSKKYNCHVHLVAHPRKAPSDKEKPGKVDVRGSGHITDLAHNVLITWRPEEEDKEAAMKKGKKVSDMILYVKKNREFGTEGGIKMKFDNLTKRFTDREI